jgi:hypothetical protein
MPKVAPESGKKSRTRTIPDVVRATAARVPDNVALQMFGFLPGAEAGRPGKPGLRGCLLCL